MDEKYNIAFSKFIHTEMRQIDIEKWTYGERIQMDPGQEYIIEWINQNAALYRQLWNNSKCQTCESWKNCGHLVKADCENYICEKLD